MTTCICYRGATLPTMPVESVSFLLMALPIIAFVCLWYLTTFSERQDWRVGFLKAALLWGSATLLITEVLSVFTAIRPTTLALAWILVIASALYVIRRHIVQEGTSPLVVARRLFALPAGERWWIENDHRRGRNHQRRHTLGKASTAQDSDKQGDTYHGSYKCEPLHQIRETAASINIPSVAIPSNGDRSRHSCAND